MPPWLATALGNAAVATALAAVVAAVSPIIRRPAVRHGLWLLVLLKLVTPPLGYLPIVPTPAPPASAALPDPAPPEPEPVIPVVVESITFAVSDLAPTTTPEPLPAPPPAPPSRPDPATLALAAWLGGAGLLGAVTLLRLLRLMSALRRAEPAPADELSRLAALAADLGLTRVPDLRVVDAHVSPFVAALGRRATVVVPARLWARLDEPQRDALLLHELAHLRRGDPWVRWVELAATGLYWWLPTLWLARRALHAAEEQACDAWVVAARPAAARSYADALIETVEFLSRAPALARLAPVPVASSGLGRLSHVARRITMVMKDRVPPRPSRAGKLALLGLGLTFLPWLPGMAAPRTEPPPLPDASPDDPSPQDRDELAAQVRIKQAQLKKATALAQGAKARLTRLQAHHERGAVSVEELDEARVAVDVAEADRDIAEAELNLALARANRAEQREAARTRSSDQVEKALRRAAESGEEHRATTATPPRTTALQGVKASADHVHAMNSMKQIGIALHNYLDQKGTFPPQAIANAKGTPLLSWRVAILPYLDQQALFDRFHLDEPWDSPHNKELLKEMPAVFRSPAMPAPSDEPGLTRFQALVGGTADHTVINAPDGAKLSDITDGTSNTIVLVEAAGTVPWTKPDDLSPGQEDEEVGRRTHKQGFLALMADGSVHRIAADLPIPVFHAMFTINGGEVIDWEQVRAKSEAAAASIGTGRLSFPGPGGSTVSIEVPADLAAGSDEEKAMRIAAEIARMLAERLQGDKGEAARRDAIELQHQLAIERHNDAQKHLAWAQRELQKAEAERHALQARPPVAEPDRRLADVEERIAIYRNYKDLMERQVAETAKIPQDIKPSTAGAQDRERDHIVDLQAKRAQARIAELQAQLDQARQMAAAARDAEQAARRDAERQRTLAEERERHAVEAVRHFQENLLTEEHARETITKDHAELIERLLKLDGEDALLREAFQALLERRPTPEELERGKEILQRTLKEKSRREVIETLIRQITSYRDEPARP
jgi:beta-lactamase regulating signal transducer with metallopeptidase domain